MIRVITYGSFDLFHEGHYNLLKRAKNLGDHLIVGVTTEQFDEERGKMNLVDSLMTRIDNVRAAGFADEIIIEDHLGQKLEDIQKYNINIFTVGTDWIGNFDYFRPYCKVVYLERTRGISSSMLRVGDRPIIRLGIVGTGRIAKRFLPEIRPVGGIFPESVFNINLESADIFAQRYEIKTAIDNITEFANTIDAVYIASPHETHFDYIKIFLNLGKHVLCEKPLVLTGTQAKEVYSIAKEKNLVLFEAIKTAYSPGFSKFVTIAAGGRIGEIKDIEAGFTKLVDTESRELRQDTFSGSVTELASYPLMAIFKLLGTRYEELSFISFINRAGVDIYTKIFMKYKNAVATAKVGLGVKSNGEMIVSGTHGYIKVDAPWWKTETFETKHEDNALNERFATKFFGDGLRYEISDFVTAINSQSRTCGKLSKDISIAIAEVIEMFINRENRTDIRS